MGLIIKATQEKKIRILGTPIETPSVYGRIRYVGDFSGKIIEFETALWGNKEYFEKKEPNILVDVPSGAQKTELKAGEKQTIQQVLICAKDFYESLGYEVEIISEMEEN